SRALVPRNHLQHRSARSATKEGKQKHMSIDSKQILDVLEAADHALGVKEVMGRLGVNPGAMTDMKRALRDLVREGAILKDGKRFRPATDKGREMPVPKRHGARHGTRELGAST